MVGLFNTKLFYMKYKSMKNLFLALLILFCCLGCQEEKLTIVQSEEQASFLQDSELKLLVQGVSSHDGSYDDVVDQSSCFSINVPYEILLNNATHTINSVEDLLAISKEDEVIPIFPIIITYATYEQLEINGAQQLLAQITQCETGVLFNDRITCVDMVYPININLYNPETSDFETVVFDHDKKTFQSIASYANNQLASIKFPISITIATGEELSISTNEMLKNQILSQVPFCK
ncbi:MAG: outer membrane protein assembly factor BamE (lipoprotein component of BamABCDE complex) [Patiriisocius sp.]|jgi:outer membrane protein assembly factor BamE (lipoprotein component of BamABCDE complex)